MATNRNIADCKRYLRIKFGIKTIKEIRKRYPQLNGVNATSQRFWKIAYKLASSEPNKQ